MQSELFGNYHNSVMMADMMEEDDIECDDEDFALAAIANSTMGSESQFLMNYAGHEEAMEVRKQGTNRT